MSSRIDKHFSVEQYPFLNTSKAALIYNSETYLSIYNTHNLFRFSLVKDNQEVIFIHFYISGAEAYNARYSGIASFDGPEINSENIAILITYLQDWGSKNGVQRFMIKNAPDFYYPDELNLENVLIQNGIELSLSELNQHIKVTHADYFALLKKNEKKRLRKCHNKGFTFRQLEVSFLSSAYDIIKQNRALKGYPMTMSYEDLLKMYKNFPDQYLLFGVFDDKTLIAVAVSIKVSDQVLYNFYHGDDFKYRTYSPIVMVLQGVYNYCQKLQIRFLDLGISSVSGVLNEGLYAFKRNCGAEDGKRNIFTLSL
ncbi:hypothetical protein [Fulvivirga sediminis]|uniref:Uncharacterized protein n=1 Tax=Fulvivirga sediminis TaxID=2803949 RepID=A0A937F8D6_9BACT|nr:hypothetical protein [Fulvivirga sediminis]MBL3656489.1 hypothetical protein [Fulvivirga sediminis]